MLLGDVSKIKTGNLDVNAKVENGRYPFFTCAQKPEKIDSYSFDCECVLVAGNGDLNVKYYGGKFDVYQRTYVVEVMQKDRLDTRFLFYFLNKYLVKLRSQSIGGVIKYIKMANLTDIELPEYSLEKQKQIIQILDAADDLRQKRREQLVLLDDYLKSVFHEMFGDPVKNDKGWNVVKLGEISKKITDGTHKTPKYKSHGITFISAKNITLKGIDWDNVKYISDEEHAFLFKRCNPKKGDVVLTKSGSLGLAAIVDVDFEFSMFESLALVKNERSKLNSIFLRAYLNSDCKDWLYGAISKGISIRHLHLIDIKGLKIFLPPLELQNKFDSIVDQVEQTKQKMRDSLHEMDNHFNALMQRYFG